MFIQIDKKVSDVITGIILAAGKIDYNLHERSERVNDQEFGGRLRPPMGCSGKAPGAKPPEAGAILPFEGPKIHVNLPPPSISVQLFSAALH